MNPILINLRKESFDGGLLKSYTDKILDKTVRETLEYMLDERPDEFNPGYTAVEAKTLERIREDVEDHLDSGLVEVNYRSSETLKFKLADLTKKLSDYPDIVHDSDSISSVSDSEFRTIYLMFALSPTGGQIGDAYES